MIEYKGFSIGRSSYGSLRWWAVPKGSPIESYYAVFIPAKQALEYRDGYDRVRYAPGGARFFGRKRDLITAIDNAEQYRSEEE
jgi:hypothetical protein